MKTDFKEFTDIGSLDEPLIADIEDALHSIQCLNK